MAERYQFLGEVGDDPFGTAIKPGWNAFHQESDLCDLHHCLSGGPPGGTNGVTPTA